MKDTLKIFFLLTLALYCAPGFAQAPTNKESSDGVSVKIGDSTYVIKQYFFVMLSAGPNRSQDSITAAKIQDAHLNNISRLAKIGKLVIAGPFGDQGNWQGVFIFNCKTKEETEELLRTDPAVAAGRLKYEIH